MAIPFYEREGFVRVGAVAKFNDAHDMPFVAYRHWSDIVKNSAVESSYMMARRIGRRQAEYLEKREKYEYNSNAALLSPRSTKRKQEEDSLKTSRELCTTAISIVTVSTEGQNSFKELLMLAKDAASEGGEKGLGKVIDAALSAFKTTNSSTSLQAKRVLCDYLGVYGGEEIEEMKIREEAARFRKMRVRMTIGGLPVENEESVSVKRNSKGSRRDTGAANGDDR